MTHSTLPTAAVDIIENNINPQFVPLLLAAPDLLAACKRVLRAWLDDEASLSEAVDACIVAINKAEGRN